MGLSDIVDYVGEKKRCLREGEDVVNGRNIISSVFIQNLVTRFFTILRFEHEPVKKNVLHLLPHA